MGFSHERQAAARTVLRARASGDPQAIEDAETAVSGYLDHEDLDEYIAEHYPNGLGQQPESGSEPLIDASELERLRQVAQDTHGFFPAPWVRMGEKNVSVIERSRVDGSITGGGAVADAHHEVFAEHITTFEPIIVLRLIAAVEAVTSCSPR